MSLLLLLLVSVAFSKVPTKAPTDEAKGKQLFRDNCWQCHGYDALGNGPASSALRSEAPALAGVLDGGPIEEQITLIIDGEGDMPGFGGTFDRRDARRILKWLATLDPETGQEPRRGRTPPIDPEDAPPPKGGPSDEGDGPDEP